MTKYLLKFIVSLCIAYSAAAQTGEIRGIIIEKSTGEAITGAGVTIESLSSVTSSDLNGNYSLHVASGLYTVRFSFISYQTVEVSGVIVEAGKTTEVNVAMEEAIMGIEGVVVTAVRRMNSEVAMIASTRTANWGPTTSSPLLGAADFTDAFLNDPFFTKVTYVGAFASDSDTDNWLKGWTNFDPQSTVY